MRLLALLMLVACGPKATDTDVTDTDPGSDTDTDTTEDTDGGDATPPDTTADAGPDATTVDTTATFTFTCDAPPCTFTCTLDDGAPEACTSPYTLSDLDVGEHTLAVAAEDAAGTVDPTPAVFAWVVTIADPWSTVAVGRQHSCGLRTSGELYCWGAGTYGAQGSSDAKPTPTRVGTASDWVALSVGDWHTCMVNSGGELYCMGYNANGRLGDGGDESQSAPIRVGTATDWASVHLGFSHSCAQKADTSIHCWGENAQGQLGRPVRAEPYDEPIVVLDATSTTTWMSLDGGKYHTCSRRSDGALFCWGQAMQGQLGTGDYSGFPAPNQTTPQRVGTDADWDTVYAGGVHTCAIRASGALWCWGNSYEGQVGTGVGDSWVWLPAQIGSATDWVDVALGEHHSCAVNGEGELYCWGRDEMGQVGDGSDTLTDDVTTPSLVGSTSDWAAVSAHYHQACAINTAGNLYCWGINEHSSLGLGHSDRVHGPALVTAP